METETKEQRTTRGLCVMLTGRALTDLKLLIDAAEAAPLLPSQIARIQRARRELFALAEELQPGGASRPRR